MDIQFHHCRYFISEIKGHTTAVQLPTKDEFLALVSTPRPQIVLMVGRSYCSYKDQFCKKIGREVALKRLQPQLFKLKHMYFEGDKVYFDLEVDDVNPQVNKLRLRLFENSSRIHLIEAV